MTKKSTAKSKLQISQWVSGKDCPRVEVVLAIEMSENPFGLFEFDGVLGLGLNSLALSNEFSFLGSLMHQKGNSMPVFSVYLSRSGDQAVFRVAESVGKV